MTRLFPGTNASPTRQGCLPLPIWACMREDGGRPAPMASLRLPCECRPWAEPLWESPPGPSVMLCVGGCGNRKVTGRRVNAENGL